MTQHLLFSSNSIHTSLVYKNFIDHTYCMYFVVVGNHHEIALWELQAHRIHVVEKYGNIRIISQSPADIQRGGIIKRGTIHTRKELQNTYHKIIWCNTKTLGISCKNANITRRYKEYDVKHSDKEIQKKGQEYVHIASHTPIQADSLIGAVRRYQPIQLFTAIDFHKPINGMNTWMMPSKLALSMTQIAAGKYLQYKKKKQKSDSQSVTIYDPFTGFGTTNFVASYVGYPSIGSDKNLTPAKQNYQRWKNQTYANDVPLILYKHNVHEPFHKKLVRKTTCVVTEWRLGPVVHPYTHPTELQQYQDRIRKVYKDFFTHSLSFFESWTQIVCTLPHHLQAHTQILDRARTYFHTRSATLHECGDIYRRKKQQVWRQLIRIHIK